MERVEANNIGRPTQYGAEEVVETYFNKPFGEKWQSRDFSAFLIILEAILYFSLLLQLFEFERGGMKDSK